MTSVATRRVLVAGGTGVTGASTVAAFAAAGWDVHGTSRRPPATCLPGTRHHIADLLDPASCRALAQATGPVDEIAFCAINEAPGSLVEKWTDPGQVDRNRAMLANLLDAVLAESPGFRHIAIVHGSKAYGVHLPHHRFTVPHREDEPRLEHENFYFAHEDEVAARSAGQDWSWTVFRAPIILGGGIGTNLSNFLALGVIASLAAIAGRRFDFLAGPDEGVFQVIDADLLGRAMVWAADAPGARGQIFNISNGDVTQWRALWPVIAQACGATVGADRPGQSCIALAAALAPTWADAVARYGLVAPTDLREFLGESFALLDFALPSGLTSVLSTIKLRKAGFADCEDTPERVRAWFRRWQREGLLPPV
ncbi:NAD-dependent epimerase/dehydratase family protein [Novosphingobium lentum]|uniref:NAD-dependent epimerase/dehydratase family protein n=1 Tax=Novosphingobium lentum TaxID=145287 RepID=UPI0008377B4B|nr:NAD-dependent epimerase/dehydratase family protein [Novosphingobium lentum]